MAPKNDEIVSILNGLIDTCEDGIQGFRTAAESVKNANANALFLSRIPNIESGEVELKAEVRRLGGDPNKRGTVEGTLHRGWINLKSAVTAKDTGAVIKECERGEEHAAKRYDDALKKELPAETRAIVERQHRGVVQNLERVRALRSATASGSSATARPAERGDPPRA
jgi:uncharacterized protein (TIGR02284 family)